MSRRATNPHFESPGHHERASLPAKIRLNNLTNQPNSSDVATLRHRIEELESKVNHLETKIQSKKKRIRRKSCEVEKRHLCEFCRRYYGTLVSLNLHVRLKHKKEKLQKRLREKEQKEQKGGREREEQK